MKQKLIEFQGEIDKTTIFVRNFTPSPLIIDMTGNLQVPSIPE